MPDPTRPASNQPGSTQTASRGNGGCVLVAVVIGALLLIAKCSDGGNTGSTPKAVTKTDQAPEALASAIAQQTPAPPQELSAHAARRGSSDVKLAASEGLPGEMIFSQNCYEAVGRGFTWRKLDECGGFDREAALALGDEAPSGAEKEIAWFESEAAAGRYLKAAIAAGLDPDAADRRLAALQTVVRGRHRPAPDPKSSATSGQSENNGVDNAMFDATADADGE